MQNHPVSQSGPIDPASIETQAEFAAALQRLHAASGLTYRDVSRDITLSAQAVHGYIRGKHLPSRWRNGALFTELLQVGYGITDPKVLDAWIAALKRVARAPGPRRADEPVPYPGLRPFHAEERDWFFGRGDLIERLLDTIKSGIASGERSLLVIGPSGAGKSSLVNVGIRSAADEHEALSGWHVERMTPGAEPLAALNAVLTAANEPCLLVLDQMEELWAESIDPIDRREFLTRLETAAMERTPPVFAILVIRADFYEQVLNDRFLVDIDEHRQVKVVPMNQAQLKEAIEQPARAVNVEIEPALTRLLLRDLAEADVHTVGALPLLALALREIWGRGMKSRMVESDYSGSGGLADIVQRTAESTLNALPDDTRGTARALLTRMVSVHEDLPLTRRRLSIEELGAFRGSHPALDEILERFTESRLLVRDEDGVTLAHDAILRAWPRLHEWIEADRRRLTAHSELDQSARRWEAGSRPHAYLYPTERLRSIEERLGPDPMLSTAERAFLDASRRKAARTRRVGRALVAAMGVMVVALATSLTFALDLRSQAVHQASSADIERRRAESRMIATRSEQLRQSDPALAAQLAVAAYQTSPTLEARSALLSATAIPTATRMPGTTRGVIERMDISPDGALLAAAVDNGDVLIWDIADPFHPVLLASRLPGVEDTIRTVRFTADGRLYSGGESSVLYMHDVNDPRRPRLLSTATGPTDGIDFIAANADTVAAGGPDTHVWLWQGTQLDGDPLRLAGPGGPIVGIAISHDGSRLAAASYDGLAALHDLESASAETAPLVLDEGYARFLNIEFSPDDHLLGAGTSAGPVVVWEVENEPRLLDELEGPTAGWSDSVAFLPQTPYLAAGASDGLWLWNLESDGPGSHLPSTGPVEEVIVHPLDGAVFAGYADGGVTRWELPGPVLTASSHVVFDIEFLSDGAALATANGRGSVWWWELDVYRRTPGRMRELRAPDESSWLIGAMSGNHDGSMIAAAGFDGRVWIFDLTDAESPPVALNGLATWALQVVFSPDGKRVAAAVNDGTVAIWDLHKGTDPLVFKQVSEHWLSAVAFAPHGDLLVTGGFDSFIQIWDASDPEHLVELGPPLEGPTQSLQHLVFSPTGTRVAAASEDGNAYIWDFSSPTNDPIVLTGNGARVLTAAFSPDERYLIAASYDGSVIVWSLEDPSSPRRYAVLTASRAGLIGVDINHAGTVIAAAGDDPAARLWLLDTGEAVALICEAAGTEVTRQEWALHVPGVDYRPPC